jgi:hypothetical protein
MIERGGGILFVDDDKDVREAILQRLRLVDSPRRSSPDNDASTPLWETSPMMSYRPLGWSPAVGFRILKAALENDSRSATCPRTPTSY